MNAWPLGGRIYRPGAGDATTGPLGALNEKREEAATVSLTQSTNRLALAARAYDAAANNPPLDAPDPTAVERVELRKALAAVLRDLPWDVLDATIGADDWPPVETADLTAPPPVAEAVTVTEDDGSCD